MIFQIILKKEDGESHSANSTKNLENELQQLLPVGKKEDVLNKINEIEKVVGQYGYSCAYTDTVQSGNIKLADREKMILGKIQMFATAKFVITDRLHGMIFCAISKTPCFVFANSNHKIKGIYEAWLKKNCLIKFYDDFNIEMLNHDIKQLLCANINETIWINEQYFEELVKELI